MGTQCQSGLEQAGYDYWWPHHLLDPTMRRCCEMFSVISFAGDQVTRVHGLLKRMAYRNCFLLLVVKCKSNKQDNECDIPSPLFPMVVHHQCERTVLRSWPASRHLEPCMISGTSSLQPIGPFPCEIFPRDQVTTLLVFIKRKTYLSNCSLIQ